MTIVFLHLPTLLPHSMTVHCANLEGKASLGYFMILLLLKVWDRSTKSKIQGVLHVGQQATRKSINPMLQPRTGRLATRELIHQILLLGWRRTEPQEMAKEFELESLLPSKIKAAKCKLHPVWKRKIIQLLQSETPTWGNRLIDKSAVPTQVMMVSKTTKTHRLLVLWMILWMILEVSMI